MNRNKRFKLLLIITAFVLVIAALFHPVMEWRAKQKCLKAGGVWNTDAGKCESILKGDTIVFWKVDYDSVSNMLFLGSDTTVFDSIMELHDLLQVLNLNEAGPELQLQKYSGDTLFIIVKNAEYLNEQMGTTGAYTWLGKTVFTLTEPDSVHWIIFDMPYGSHASPGVYTRKDFKGLIRN